jgi:hypothetical protein
MESTYPHQHGSLTGGFAMAPFVTDGPEDVDIAEMLDGGMLSTGNGCFLAILTWFR